MNDTHEIDADERDDYGTPLMHGPVTRPSVTFRAPHTGPVTQSTDNSRGKRINDALPWACGAMLIGGIAIALAVDARIDASRAERESRMLEYYVLELDAKLIAAGFKTDAESVAARLRKQRGDQ